jgi:hypothetical protein
VKKILFFLLLSLTFSSVKSQTGDSLRVSLLTEAPLSKHVWAIFGHTALRVSDPARKTDTVLNWGMFDTEIPNFLLHFVEGKTDYFLSAIPYQYFISQCEFEGATVFEQTINIPEGKKTDLLRFLQTNLLPENIGYRYNFVFDNCTTRPRDIIERFCGGTLIYPEQTHSVTFRQLFHQYTRPYPWLEMGIDCVIGSGADSLITFRNELFLPEKLMNALNNSVVKLPDGDERPIVLDSKTIVRPPVSQSTQLAFWDHPIATGWLIFFIYLALCIIFALRLSPFTFRLLPFALLFFVAGAGGCIVFMLNFFSVHPCVQANWNILWLHPLHFIAVVGFFFRKSYRWIRWYHAANFVLLSCFLLGSHWIPQELNLAFIPFILCLWMVSGLQVVILKQKRK